MQTKTKWNLATDDDCVFAGVTVVRGWLSTDRHLVQYHQQHWIFLCFLWGMEKCWNANLVPQFTPRAIPFMIWSFIKKEEFYSFNKQQKNIQRWRPRNAARETRLQPAHRRSNDLNAHAERMTWRASLKSNFFANGKSFICGKVVSSLMLLSTPVSWDFWTLYFYGTFSYMLPSYYSLN